MSTMKTGPTPEHEHDCHEYNCPGHDCSAEWHWTDEERAWIRSGEGIRCDAVAWTVFATEGEFEGEWQVWKGFHEKSHRLYRSPAGRYYLGDTEDVPPYRSDVSTWRGRVIPGCEPEDTDELRRLIAAEWFDDQGWDAPEDLRDVYVTSEDLDDYVAAARAKN